MKFENPMSQRQPRPRSPLVASTSSLVVCVSAVGSLIAGCRDTDQRPEPAQAKEAWNEPNRPELFSTEYVRQFESLPTMGKTRKEPWADTYWPYYKGGIAARWSASSPAMVADAWSGRLHSREELAALSADELAQLSPSEKFDILRGDYGYALTRHQRSEHSPSDDTWWGLCDGWAAASIHFDEPGAVVLANGDGIQIPFGSSDVKALLTFQQSRAGRAVILGERCNANLSSNPLLSNSRACRDTNAGSFHIVLANEVGLRGESIVMDITRDAEVWNQPIQSFVTRKISERRPSRGSASGTVVEYEMETDVTYTVEMQASAARRVGTGNARKVTRYRYFVEVNASGDVVGGSWVSKQRPDFLWKSEPAKFEGFFAPLKTLYEESVRDLGVPVPLPTAAPLPTAMPVVTPVETPSPVVTRTPGSPHDTANAPRFYDAGCPADTRLDASLSACVTVPSASGEWVDPVAIGNFTLAMTELCEANGGGYPCLEEKPYLLADGSLVFFQRWSLEFARSLRGTEDCPRGASRDRRTKVCTELGRDAAGRNVRHAYGPFSDDLREKCRNAGGGTACVTQRWNANILDVIFAAP